MIWSPATTFFLWLMILLPPNEGRGENNRGIMITRILAGLLFFLRFQTLLRHCYTFTTQICCKIQNYGPHFCFMSILSKVIEHVTKQLRPILCADNKKNWLSKIYVRKCHNIDIWSLVKENILMNSVERIQWVHASSLSFLPRFLDGLMLNYGIYS